MRADIGLNGQIRAILVGPNRRIDTGWLPNLITEVGEEYYMERAAGIATPPNQVTGMKLGTGIEPPTLTGAGAELDLYLPDSHIAIAGGFPTSTLETGVRVITWQALWGAGKATTASPITEVVLVNDVLADATTLAANTVSRALITGVPSKGAGDTLTVVWRHRSRTP